jgi:hypothetical protein
MIRILKYGGFSIPDFLKYSLNYKSTVLKAYKIKKASTLKPIDQGDEKIMICLDGILYLNFVARAQNPIKKYNMVAARV